MKISLKLMTYFRGKTGLAFLKARTPVVDRGRLGKTNILMAEVFEELQFAVRSLCENRRAEWFHNLLDGDGLTGQLIFGGA